VKAVATLLMEVLQLDIISVVASAEFASANGMSEGSQQEALALGSSELLEEGVVGDNLWLGSGETESEPGVVGIGHYDKNISFLIPYSFQVEASYHMCCFCGWKRVAGAGETASCVRDGRLS
jgi:hypothetical protein